VETPTHIPILLEIAYKYQKLFVYMDNSGTIQLVMSEPTVSLRFPRRLHVDAKIAAAKRHMSLQDFVEGAVVKAMKTSSTTLPSGLEAKLAKLPEPSRKLAKDFITLMEISPDFYIGAINKYVTGMLTLFKRVDKRIFDPKK
jgi:hypothetical protein